MIDVINTLDDFERLRPEWQRLEVNPRMRIFQTFSWCWHAWEKYLSKERGNRLWILRWYQEGKNDAVIFPFYIDSKRTLRFIMDTHSDLLDAVYLSGENRHWCYKEVAETILKEPMIKSICLQKMYGEGEALQYLGVFLRGALIYRDNAFSWLTVKKGDDFIASQVQLKSKDKADLRAIRRKSGDYRLRILRKEAGDVFPAEVVKMLRQQMQGANSRGDSFCSDEMVAFVESVFDDGGVDILVLEHRGAVVALNFLLKKDARYLSWIFLYTDSRSSTAMYTLFLTEWARANEFVFDFGVGVYSYKIGTFRPQMGVTFALRLGKSPWREFRQGLKMLSRVGKDYWKSVRATGR